MAQIDLGSIKFNWKGSYSGATAYVVDDVVESSGSSYICIAATTGNAPPNATYWEQMSSAGTDGTDLTTTLTTQGDIVYRDASGLARLGAGTSGQALITGGAGANPSWGTVSAGKVLQFVSSFKTDTFSVTSNTFTDTGLQAQITPSSASNKVLIICSGNATNSAALSRTHLRIDGTTTQFVGDAAAGFEASTTICTRSTDSGWIQIPFTISGIDVPNSTSQQTYKLQMAASSSSTAKLNRPSNTPDANSGNTMSSIILMELEG